MEYFPLFLRLKDQPVLVVGAGSVAARKVALLLAADARITVVASAVCEEIENLARRGKLTLICAEFMPSQVLGQRLVVAATDDEAINETVSRAANQAGVLVNVVDDAMRSDCIVPAIIDRNPVLVACSTGGSSPVLATELRAQLEVLLPPRLGDLARFARQHRAVVKARFPALAARRRFWVTVMRGEIAAAVLANRSADAEQLLARLLGEEAEAPMWGQRVLVMLGSEDPDQLKLGALRELFKADLILHDHGIAADLLNLGRRDAPRQSISPAASAADYVHSRLPLFIPSLNTTGLNEAGPNSTGAVVYLSLHPSAWGESLVHALRARGVLTQVW